MALLLDKLLATKEDFNDFRSISKNIATEKIDIFIRESQLIEIRAFLGSTIYLQLQEDYDENTKTFGNPIFNSLWFGVDYINKKQEEVRFNGYMNSLVYFAYGRFLLQQQMNVSRFGLESLQDTISEDTPLAQVKTKAKEALSMAIQYQEDCVKFIEVHATDYPTFKTKESKGKNTSFTFFRV